MILTLGVVVFCQWNLLFGFLSMKKNQWYLFVISNTIPKLIEESWAFMSGKFNFIKFTTSCIPVEESLKKMRSKKWREKRVPLCWQEIIIFPHRFQETLICLFFVKDISTTYNLIVPSKTINKEEKPFKLLNV